MWWNVQRANAVTGGIWLIGLGVLFATKLWWPGILFLAGATAIIQGTAHGARWPSIHGGLWLILIASWALMRFNITVLLVALGVYVIVAALIRPNDLRKPYVDRTLE
jgi:hydrogenase/urease accessory protein HupE